MVEDQKYLNEWTVKNNYPLSLILNIIENIGTKKIFTKLDLPWEYDNMQIKERDEQKAAFSTSEVLFKPTVIFFILTNSPAIFQTIMNNILRDLINTGEVASFIDNIIVGTEEEKEYNEVVEEVVKRLAENNLYIKPEKYKQKMRELGFLEVVIGPEGIKIEEEKVKEVLDWLTPKIFKDVKKFLGLVNYYQWLIKNFTAIARPLHNLVKKNQKWNWTERQDKVF